MSEKQLTLPLTKKDLGLLKVGDKVLLSGVIVTGRDAAHKWLVERSRDEVKEVLKNTAIYHCGPIMLKKGNEWKCLAAGPTTSIREEPYLADVMKDYGVRCVIGKGGMGEKTAEALKKYGGVYLFAVGGAAVVYAEKVKSVKTVHMLEEFGVPEALWVMEVEDFPLIVTMDSHGESLHEKIENQSKNSYQEII